MKTILLFDIPRCKAGKALRMRVLRRFCKEEIKMLQDSVWDVSGKEMIIQQILNDFQDLKQKIMKESSSEAKIFVIKGNVEKV